MTLALLSWWCACGDYVGGRVHRYVHRVFVRDSRGHLLELMRLFINSTWRVRDLTRRYCEPDKDVTICDPVATQRGLGVSVYFVTASMNGECHIHELRHKSFRGWRHVVLTRGKSRKWLVSPRNPRLVYNRGLRCVAASPLPRPRYAVCPSGTDRPPFVRCAPQVCQRV